MSSQFSRGSHDPHSPFVYPPDSPIRLDEARLDAWARALGASSRYPRPGRKPHRGELPDVDFSRVVPVPRKPMLAVRLWRAVFKRRAALPSADRTDAKDGPVAEGDGPSHMIGKPFAAHSTSVRHGPKDGQQPRRAA